jgi:hypothetical protein
MKKMPERIYVRWSDDELFLEATPDYKECVGDADKVVVGVYDLDRLAAVEKHIAVSTRRVSKQGKVGRYP